MPVRWARDVTARTPPQWPSAWSCRRGLGRLDSVGRLRMRHFVMQQGDARVSRRVHRSLRALRARANPVRPCPPRNLDPGAARRATTRGPGRLGRTLAGVVGLLLLFVLEPELLRFTDWAEARAVPRDRAAHALVLSEQARRFLVLQYKSYPTEFMGCMIGEVRGNAIVVQRIAPADVDPPKSPRRTSSRRRAARSPGGPARWA